MSESDEMAEAVPAGPVVRITTGARLHFGLLRTEIPFGGMGVMIASPATEVLIRPATEFACVGAAAERVRQVADRLRSVCDLSSLPACDVSILQRPPSHHGLGSGTQLAMAVAEGLSRFVDRSFDRRELACEVAGRGERSAVGVHGYFQGGLIYEDHRGDRPSTLNPVVAHCLVPDAWRVILFIPRQPIRTISGEAERRCFALLEERESHATETLEQIAQSDLLPAVRAGAFAEFCDAVARFNEQSGLLFQGTQGGAYNGRVMTETVQSLRSLGARGVGQSSWGPGIFCWCESEAEARRLMQQVPSELAEGQMAQVKNDARTIVVEDSPPISR